MFNLNNINKKILKTNKVLINIYESCEKYVINPNDENGEEMVNNIIQLEDNINNLKKNVASMVNSISGEDSNIEKEVIIKENGIIIKKD